jgi:hypothetical protein
MKKKRQIASLLYMGVPKPEVLAVHCKKVEGERKVWLEDIRRIEKLLRKEGSNHMKQFSLDSMMQMLTPAKDGQMAATSPAVSSSRGTEKFSAISTSTDETSAAVASLLCEDGGRSEDYPAGAAPPTQTANDVIEDDPHVADDDPEYQPEDDAGESLETTTDQAQIAPEEESNNPVNSQTFEFLKRRVGLMLEDLSQRLQGLSNDPPGRADLQTMLESKVFDVTLRDYKYQPPPPPPPLSPRSEAKRTYERERSRIKRAKQKEMLRAVNALNALKGIGKVGKSVPYSDDSEKMGRGRRTR